MAKMRGREEEREEGGGDKGRYFTPWMAEVIASARTCIFSWVGTSSSSKTFGLYAYGLRWTDTLGLEIYIFY
eukprot:1361672-Amorphochlora_amoeboformis.AAC.1